MAQVYPRIANPYMPQGTPDKTNAPNTTTNPFYAPGEIGGSFNDQNVGGSWLRVTLEPTSATPVAGSLAFWNSRSTATVTATKANSDVGASGAINRVAGVFALAVTPGNVCDIMIQKLAYPMVSADNSGVIGGVALANTAGGTNNLVGAATVTTAPVSQVIGVNVSAPAANLVNVDINIGFVD